MPADNCSVLEWWSINGNSFKQWPCAARIVFAMSPNSASCERVFSILSLMFGDTQLGSLADIIRAALMLRYNDRAIGYCIVLAPRCEHACDGTLVCVWLGSGHCCSCSYSVVPTYCSWLVCVCVCVSSGAALVPYLH